MGRFSRSRCVWLGAGSMLALACSPALAQTSPPGAPANSPASAPAGADATSFPTIFFAPYNPVTAADMVARVPGFELRDGDDRRGFGAAAGNLLINGERPSSKTAASELLKRIPAGNVVRIDVLSGSDANSDVRGQSQLVNVVLAAASKQTSSTTFVAGLRYLQFSSRAAWVLQASKTFVLSPRAEIAIDLQAPNLLGRGESREILVDRVGTITGSRFQIGQPDNASLQAAANLRWRPTTRDSVHVNLQFVPAWNASDAEQVEYAPSGALRNSLTGRTEYDHNHTAELGGDWEHRLAPSLTAKLITLVSQASVDQHDRFDVFAAPATTLVRTQDRSTTSGERIVRGQLKWTHAAHTLEFGTEGAFNYRDTTLDIVSQPTGGVATHVPLAVAAARVEETRGEAFVTDVWTASSRLAVEGGVNVEVSRIAQTGDQIQQRQFRYVKPRVSATYTFSPRSILRVSLLRDVAQLDFTEFSSAVDFVNTASTQGNPNLKPEKAWKSRVEWEQRLAERTSITIAAFADRVEDVHDLIAINGFDAYGNIGVGRRLGVELRANTPLDRLGLHNAELRFNGLYQQTRVTDPITGQTRSFSVPVERQGSVPGSPTLNAGNKDWAYVVNFRQNRPRLSSSWGAAVIQWSGRAEYRRAEIIESVRPEPRLDLYFETTAVKPVTMRISVNNLMVTAENRTRTFYVGGRGSNTIQKAELRHTNGGPEGTRVLGFQVSGKF